MNKEQSPIPPGNGQINYSRHPGMKLPENYVIRDGLLYKGNLPVSLAASGIIEAAAQGFLHVNKAEEYESK